MFNLHQRLAADTVEIADWPLCRALLMNDRSYPWLVLVPRREGLADIHDVAAADHAMLMAEITRASAALESVWRPDKLNVAAIGNVVAQLHIHVVARFRDDPAWPGPVWGAAPPVPYDAPALETTLAKLRAALS